MTETVELIVKLIVALSGLLGAAVTAATTWERLRRGRRKPGPSRSARFLGWVRRPLPILLGGLSLLLLSVGFFVLQSREHAAQPRATAVRLLRELVSDETRSCREADAVEGAIASLSCTLPGPMESLTMSLFASREKLEREIETRADARGLSQGSCATQRFAWQRWSLGRLLCAYGGDGARARIEWSRSDSRLLLEAEGPGGADADDIYSWWSHESNGEASHNRIDFPDGYEEYVLDRAELPAERCRRGEGFKESSAAMWCQTPAVGTVFLGYYLSRRPLDGALGPAPVGDGVCASSRGGPRETGERRYSLAGVDVGTRQCYADRERRTSTVTWTNERTQMYGFVEVGGSDLADLARLFRWWQRDGVRLTD